MVVIIYWAKNNEVEEKREREREREREKYRRDFGMAELEEDTHFELTLHAFT